MKKIYVVYDVLIKIVNLRKSKKNILLIHLFLPPAKEKCGKKWHKQNLIKNVKIPEMFIPSIKHLSQRALVVFGNGNRENN